MELEVPEASSGAVTSGTSERKAHVRQHRVFRSFEPELLPFQIESRLPLGSPARLIRSALAEVDLSVLQELYEDHGGVGYLPVSMLGILLLGYELGITGSRKLQDACVNDLRFWHVAQGATPDHVTINRFRQRIAPHMNEVLALVVNTCARNGLAGLKRVGIDGTKLKSAASQMRRWLSASDKEDLEATGLQIPETSDPDARQMKSSKGSLLGYNAQAAVDFDTGLVVATDVSDSSSDSPSFEPMLDKIYYLCGQNPEEIVADAGYESNEAFQICSRRGIEATIASQTNSALFWTLTQDGEILCPMGEKAEPAGTSTIRGKPVTVLRVQTCESCIFFNSCCTHRYGRSLKFPAGCDPTLRIQAASKARSPNRKLAMQERMAKVEPFFGDVKWNKGLGRLKLRGMKGARLEFALMALARNLKILGRLLRCLLQCILGLDRPANHHIAVHCNTVLQPG
jgi:transposase